LLDGFAVQGIIFCFFYIGFIDLFNGIGLIADNNSSDNSRRIAESLGARVVSIDEEGYGSALRGGIKDALGKYIIFGDCDCSYNFSELDAFVLMIRQGYDLVVGNRFNRQMERGAMPFIHKYFGVPLLSFLASIRFKTELLDYHCGLRAINKESYDRLSFTSSGMEFATELIAKFALAKFSIAEVPVAYRKDRREGPSHLNTLRDGIRHIKFIFSSKIKEKI